MEKEFWRRFPLFVLVAVIFICLFSTSVTAQNLDTEDAVNQGGESSGSGNYNLDSSIGQTAPGYSSSENFALESGIQSFYSFVRGGVVYDTDGIDPGVDIDTTVSKNMLYAAWSGFSAVDSVISYYQVAVGDGVVTNEERTRFLDWTNVGNVNFYDISLELQPDVIYYISVRAATLDGTISQPISSDGVTLTEAADSDIVLVQLLINGEIVDVNEISSLTDTGTGFFISGIIENADEVFIYIYDSEGNVVWEISTEVVLDNKFEIDLLPDIPDGEYFLQMIGKNEFKTVSLLSIGYIREEERPVLVEEEEVFVEKEEAGPGVVEIISSAIGEIISIFTTPEAKEINEQFVEPSLIAATIPTAASLSVVAASFGVTITNLPYFLRYIFLLPFSIFKRKRYWGVVYNYLTKKKLPFIKVSLKRADTKEQVKDFITDTMGRYGFVAEPGKYYLDIDDGRYKFPRLSAAEIGEGAYNGGGFTILSEQPIIFDIPILPKEAEARIVKRRWFDKGLNIIAFPLAITGVAMSLISVVIDTSVFNVTTTLLYLIMFYIIWILRRTAKIKCLQNVVLDSKTEKGIPFAVVRIFGKRNQLKDVAFTDAMGKFSSRVGLKGKMVNVVASGFSFPSNRSQQKRGMEDSLLILDKSKDNVIWVD